MKLKEPHILLKQAQTILNNIENSYETYLAQKEDPIELQIEIKDFLDKVNPALEYTAFFIFNEYCSKHISPEKLESKQRRVYFPMRQTQKEFDKYVNNTFPGLLEEHPDIAKTFRKYQPFPTRPKWLFHLKDLSNDNKHRYFSKQSHQTHTHINNLNLPGNSSISGLTLVTEGDIHPISINDQPLNLENTNNLPKNINFDGSVEKDFYFKGIDQPVLKTLRRIYRSSPTVISDIEKLL